jgi:hypothetical protein
MRFHCNIRPPITDRTPKCFLGDARAGENRATDREHPQLCVQSQLRYLHYQATRKAAGYFRRLRRLGHCTATPARNVCATSSWRFRSEQTLPERNSGEYSRYELALLPLPKSAGRSHVGPCVTWSDQVLVRTGVRRNPSGLSCLARRTGLGIEVLISVLPLARPQREPRQLTTVIITRNASGTTNPNSSSDRPRSPLNGKGVSRHGTRSTKRCRALRSADPAHIKVTRIPSCP